jgi:uncharacterized membrane protein YhaH (DUF805 family)
VRRSKLNLVEIVGLLPSSLVLGPLIVYGLLGIILVLGSMAASKNHPLGGRLMTVRAMAPYLLLMSGALAGLVGTWAGLLLGAEHLRQRARRRWPVLVCLVAGLGAASYWLSWMGAQQHKAPLFDARGWAVWAAFLAPPILVGAHQLYLLVRSTPLARDGRE